MLQMSVFRVLHDDLYGGGVDALHVEHTDRGRAALARILARFRAIQPDFPEHERSSSFVVHRRYGTEDHSAGAESKGPKLAFWRESPDSYTGAQIKTGSCGSPL